MLHGFLASQELPLERRPPMTATVSREIRLKRRPVGLPSAADFDIASVPIPALGAGEVLVRNL
jgi:NADPH-dependent curcumin reductase CurA